MQEDGRGGRGPRLAPLGSHEPGLNITGRAIDPRCVEQSAPVSGILSDLLTAVPADLAAALGGPPAPVITLYP